MPILYFIQLVILKVKADNLPEWQDIEMSNK